MPCPVRDCNTGFWKWKNFLVIVMLIFYFVHLLIFVVSKSFDIDEPQIVVVKHGSAAWPKFPPTAPALDPRKLRPWLGGAFMELGSCH